MKNNKGITLTEIIISITLISIVLLFLFTLLVTVKDVNKESEVNSSYLINKSLILKNIEEDLHKATEISISKCDIKDFYTNFQIPTEDINKVRQCIKLRYKDASGNWEVNADDSPKFAYIGLYYYDSKSSYVISYIHENIKATRLLNEYEKYNIINDILNDNFKIKINLDNSSNKCYVCSYDKTTANCNNGFNGCTSTINDQFSTITIPIIGPDEKDYSIIISYYGKVTIER